MMPRKRALLIIIAIVAVAGVVFALFIIAGGGSPRQDATSGQKPARGEELPQQDARFGTDPDRHYLPDTAIDAQQPPNIVLEATDSPEEPLPYYSIGPNTYMLFGNIAEVDRYNRGFNGNAGFVVTAEGVVVIDSLGTPKLGRRLIATIRRVTDKPIRYLIITHNHPDHAYGAVAFRKLGGVNVVAHKGTLDYIYSERIETSAAYRRSFIPEDMADFAPVAPDTLVNGPRFSKVTLKVGDRTFDIYNVGRHHSFGDLVVHQVEDNIVWISDLAFNQRTTFMGDGNSRQAIDSQNWLLKKFANAKLMVPGHGSAQTSPFPMVKKTQSYMKRLREMMAKAVEEGIDFQDAVDRADFPEWRGTRLYELNQRSNANFVYREMEQELF